MQDQRKLPTVLGKAQPHGLTTTDGRQNITIASPEETDQIIRVSLKPLMPLLQIQGYDKDNNPLAMKATGPLPADLRKVAISGLEMSLITMPTEQIGALIEKVYMKTARRQGEQLDLNKAIKCYMEELETYPADIVHHALTEWPKISKWWPTWFDLAEIMDWRTNTRRLKLAALQEAADV